jgi:hypothetical protein
MSLMDRIKSMFSGGSADDHADADDDHSHEPVEPPLPQADPALMPTADAARSEDGENPRG